MKIGSKQQRYVFEPHGTGSRTQSMTFTSVKEYIVLKVQKIYDHGADIAATIRDGEKLDLDDMKPKGEISKKVNDDEKAAEQKLFDTILEKEVEEFVRRKQALSNNMKKAYAMIFQEHCSRTMQIRIKEHPEFETKIQDDPVELLEVIGKLMHEPIRATYPYLSLAETLARVLNMRQREGEELQEYGERFKQERRIVKSSLGEDFLDTFVENTREYQDAGSVDQKKMKDEAFEMLMTMIFMRGSDQRKYGSWMYDLAIQYAGLGEQAYPKTITGAVRIMSKVK